MRFKLLRMPRAWIAAMIIAASFQILAVAPGDLREHRELRKLDYILLGEVHDNERLHKLRMDYLSDASSTLEGRPVVLALEQFDVVRQGDLERFLAPLSDLERQDPATAKKLAMAAGFNFEGWDWKHYEPALQLALRHHWKVRAANLSREQAMALSKGGTSPLLANLNLEWTGQELARLAQDMQDGHCGLLPERAIAGMVKAQQARDAQMARIMTQAKSDVPGSLVFLLAGNGHVRKDTGVPRYLRALDPQGTVLSWGFIEASQDEAPSAFAYDDVIAAKAQARPDLCEGLKEQWRTVPKR